MQKNIDRFLLLILFIFCYFSPVWAYITNQSADIVLGQPNMLTNTANTGGLSSKTLNNPGDVFVDGARLFITDSGNNRVLIFNSLPSTNYSSADIVMGQPNMTSNAANNNGLNANTLYSPGNVYRVGSKLLIPDMNNNRVLIFNTSPTSNFASADVVIGQPNMTSNTANNGGVSAKSLKNPTHIYSDGSRLFITDCNNSRILIFNAIPTSNFASADVVIGQPNMTSNTENNGGLNSYSLKCAVMVIT